uniref:Uncharacterized protein n=1 Tax=Arundo donax TaxID=35708 RepID=A0A0A9GK69_ARUDO
MITSTFYLTTVARARLACLPCVTFDGEGHLQTRRHSC